MGTIFKKSRPDAEIDHDAWAAAEQRQADERVELGEMIARMTA